MNNRVVKIICWALAAACLFGVGLGIGYVRDAKKDSIEKVSVVKDEDEDDGVVKVSNAKKSVNTPAPTPEITVTPEVTEAPAKTQSYNNSGNTSNSAPVSTAAPTVAPTVAPTATPAPTSAPTPAPTAAPNIDPTSKSFWKDLGNQALQKGIEYIGGLVNNDGNP